MTTGSALAEEPPGVSRTDHTESYEPPSSHPTVFGFFPIWESRADCLGSQEFFLGTKGVGFGITDRIQIGLQPIHYVYRSPNAEIKTMLLQNSNYQMTLKLASFQLLDGASRSSFSPLYSSRLENPDFSVFLLPLSVSIGWSPLAWFRVHSSTTLLTLWTPSKRLGTELTLGQTLVLDFSTRMGHSLSFHMGEVGFWAHDFYLSGVSYRFQKGLFEFQFGYFYRFYPEGTQSAPLLSLGIWI